MKPIISVIVPVYNASNFLIRCINSILNQTFVDFELILIDDCSVDDSYEICKQYAEKDERVRVVKNDVNHGVSYTRNNGIEISNGDYVAFVDSDDYVSKYYLETLIKNAQKHPSFLSMSSLISFSNDKAITDDIAISEKTETVEKKKYLCNQYCYHPWVWATLFESKTLKDNNIKFAENARFSEDAHFVAKYMCFVDGIVISQNRTYYYFLNPNGGAINKDKKDYTEKDVLSRYSSIHALADAVDFIKDHDPSLVDHLETGYCFLAANVLLMAERAKIKKFIHKKELKAKLGIKKVIRCNRSFVLKQHKMLVFFVNISPKLANFLLNLKRN